MPDNSTTAKVMPADDLPIEIDISAFEALAEEQNNLTKDVRAKTAGVLPAPTHSAKPGITPPPVPQTNHLRKVSSVPPPPPGQKPSSTPPPVPPSARKKIDLKLVKPGENLQTRPMILDGENATDLADSMESFELASGDSVTSACDKGFAKNEQDLNTFKNEDRTLVIPANNSITVLDGMGKYGNGDRAAQIIAEEIWKLPNNIKSALENAQIRMAGEKIDNGGACIQHVKINIDKNKRKSLDILQAGDVKVIVFDKNGRIKFESRDESIVQILKDGGVTDPVMKAEFESKGLPTQAITEDGSYYHPARAIVLNAITKNLSNLRRYAPVPLESGYRVVVASDGITDNLTNDEIWEIMKSRNSQDAIEEISDVTNIRMLDAERIRRETITTRPQAGKYSDGYKTEPKPDNRGIAILDIN